MRIRERLISHTVMTAFIAVIATSVVLGILSYWVAKAALEKEIMDDLVSIRELRKEQVEQHFDMARKQILDMASDPTVIDAMEGMNTAFHNYYTELDESKRAKFKPDAIKKYFDEFAEKYQRINKNTEFSGIDKPSLLNLFNKASFALQYYYSLTNPYPVGEKQNLDTIEDATNYSKFHKKYHPFFHEYIDQFQYYDMFLVDIDTGNIVYTVAKELDFSTSLVNGPYANTVLGKVFREAKESARNTASLSDFESYIPSYNKRSAFIAAPIFKESKKIGVLIIQLSSDSINDIMSSENQWEKIGLGESGETYLVGPDFHLRSLSRFHKETKSTPITNVATANALRGKSGFTIMNAKGKSVLTAYAPLKVPGLHWVIVSEISESEAFAPIILLRNQFIVYTIMVMGGLLVISFLISFRLSRKISYPIERLSGIVHTLAHDRDLTQRIFLNSKDELEDMASALNHLMDSVQAICQEALQSTNQMRSTIAHLTNVAEHLGGSSSGDGTAANQASAKALLEARQDLTKMSDKLQTIASQFKTMEDEEERREDW